MLDIGIENATAFQMSGRLTESDVSLVLADTKEKIESLGIADAGPGEAIALTG